MGINFDALAAEFPREAINWRCQTLTKNGDKGLALAYIDARDVMRRLDEACGPAGWQDRYEVHGTKTICYLSLKIGEEWITKADGAGDTDVEAEKGSISDAFKRVAVKWGIGRYLYDVPAPWVPCETFDAGGKKRWSKWTDDPWNHVRQPRPAPVAARAAPAARPTPQLVASTPFDPAADEDRRAYMALAETAIHNAEYATDLDQWWHGQSGKRREYGIVKGTPEYERLIQLAGAAKARLPASVLAAG